MYFHLLTMYVKWWKMSHLSYFASFSNLLERKFHSKYYNGQKYWFFAIFLFSYFWITTSYLTLISNNLGRSSLHNQIASQKWMMLSFLYESPMYVGMILLKEKNQSLFITVKSFYWDLWQTLYNKPPSQTKKTQLTTTKNVKHHRHSPTCPSSPSTQQLQFWRWVWSSYGMQMILIAKTRRCNIFYV